MIEYLDSSRGKYIIQQAKEQKIRGAEAAGASVFNFSSKNFSVDIDDDLDNDRNDTWGDEHEHAHAQPLPTSTTSASSASAEPLHDHHTSVSEPFPLPADGNIFTATSCGYASGRSHVCGNTTQEPVVFSSDEDDM